MKKRDKAWPGLDWLGKARIGTAGQGPARQGFY